MLSFSVCLIDLFSIVHSYTNSKIGVPTIQLTLTGGERGYHVGPYIVLSNEDSSNLAYIGMNSNVIKLWPFDVSPAPFGTAHAMYTDDGNGYFNLLKLMIANAESFPIPIHGFADDMHCSPRTQPQKELLCEYTFTCVHTNNIECIFFNTCMIL